MGDVTSEKITSSTVSLDPSGSGVVAIAGERVFYVEVRPSEAGRQVVQQRHSFSLRMQKIAAIYNDLLN